MASLDMSGGRAAREWGDLQEAERFEVGCKGALTGDWDVPMETHVVVGASASELEAGRVAGAREELNTDQVEVNIACTLTGEWDVPFGFGGDLEAQNLGAESGEPVKDILSEATVSTRSCSQEELDLENMDSTVSTKVEGLQTKPYAPCWMRRTFVGAVAMLVLASVASLACYMHWSTQGGDEDGKEYIVHTAGHEVNDSDVHTVFTSMRAGERNLTVQLLDSQSDTNYTVSIEVERFDAALLGQGKLLLLINEESGGFAVGNTTVKALVCESDGEVERGCVLETTHPRSLLSDNEADVIKHSVTAVIAGAVLITALVVAPGAAAGIVGAGAGVAGCFPARAMVQSTAGLHMIQSATIGTMLMTSQGFAPMYLSGHQDAAAVTTMVQVTLASNHTLAVTPDHYLPLPGGIHKSAGRLAIGDELFVQTSAGFAPMPITALGLAEEVGLFNPYTTTGDVVVDGVLASCHSSWFLEGVVSESRTVQTYQQLLAPLRLLHGVAPGWLARFAEAFADEPKALSEVGVFRIIKTAILTSYSR